MSIFTILDGDDLQTTTSFKAIELSLIDLIAETSIWVHPDNAPLVPIYPNIKRGDYRDKGKIIDGFQIDDNTYPNNAVKKAISSRIKFKNYTVCHIWPRTTYDARYHTLLPNLVLIPRVIAGLSDFSQEVINVLKYRSWELYGWHPEEEDAPTKPDYYPKKWREFISDEIIPVPRRNSHRNKIVNSDKDRETREKDKVFSRVPKWLRHPQQINTTLLNLYMTLSENDTKAVDKETLRRHFREVCHSNFDAHYPQMKNFGDKNHGKVFEEDDDERIRLWSPVASFICSLFR